MVIAVEKRFNLEERTARFGEAVLEFCKNLPSDARLQPLLIQLIRCSSSVGANYCEADDAESKKDFRHKIGICKKESRESKHFLRLLKVAYPEQIESITSLWQEAYELNLIFNSIFRKVS